MYNMYGYAPNQYGGYPRNPYQQSPMQQSMQNPQMQNAQQVQYDVPIQETRFATKQEAESHIMFPNTKILFIDKSIGMAFLKSADNLGQSSIRYFQIVEVNPNAPQSNSQEQSSQVDMAEYIKKSDLEGLGFVTHDQLKDILSRMLTSQQNQSEGAKANGTKPTTKNNG